MAKFILQFSVKPELQNLYALMNKVQNQFFH